MRLDRGHERRHERLPGETPGEIYRTVTVLGSDLLSACVFCAGLLLGGDLRPFNGTSAEIGASYATLQRRHDIDAGRDDISNVTPKFALVGLRRAESAAEGLGAGTPAREWAARLSLAPSHDEQEQRPVGVPGRTTSSGTGRYENFALLYRAPAGLRDSIEVAWTRRSHKATDLVNEGGENYVISEERSLAAERSDLAIGARHRLRGWEIAGAARGTRVDSKNATAGASHDSSGWLFGASLEARLQKGRWTLSLAAETLGGSLDTHEESLPDFAPRNSTPTASLQSVSVSAGRSWTRTDVFLGVALSRARLPFVSLAILGTETVAFEQGLHPASSLRTTVVDLALRRSIGAGIRARLSVQALYGVEVVTLTDAAGLRPPRRIRLDWLGAGGKGSGGGAGFLGSPAFTLGIAAEFAVGASRP